MIREKIYIALVVALIVGVAFLLNKCSRDCEAKGGVYLIQEYKCVKGIEIVK